MVNGNPSAQRDQTTQRINQFLTGLVACLVVGVLGAMAYQNRESLRVPDRNAAWAGFWKKKLSDKRGVPKFDDPALKPTIDWDQNVMDNSRLLSQGLQFNAADFSSGGAHSSSSGHRRHKQ